MKSSTILKEYSEEIESLGGGAGGSAVQTVQKDIYFCGEYNPLLTRYADGYSISGLAAIDVREFKENSLFSGLRSAGVLGLRNSISSLNPTPLHWVLS
jgi:hypothetical protein